MIKSKISAVLTGVLLVLPCVAGAAYPVYQNYRGAQPMVQGVQPMVQGGYMPAANNRMVQPAVVNNGMVMYPQYANNVVAAQPTRITGALPRVGSSQTTAGRQYYQPADYDRLAGGCRIFYGWEIRFPRLMAAINAFA